MSNTLRRPMFRMGGQVNSQGTGIMSGLEPRQNYATAGPVLSYEDQLKKQKRIQDILRTDFKTAEEFGKEYDAYVESLDPTMLMGIDEFGPGTYGESLEEKKIIIYRKFKKAYALYSGSDINLDEIVQQNKTQIQTDYPIILSQIPDLPPVIAKRHLHQFGALRIFKKHCVFLLQLINYY